MRRLFALALMVLAGAGVATADSPVSRETLRELPGVSVLLEALDPDVERWGFSTQQLQTDIELRLRRAGVPIRPAKGEPFLHVWLSLTSHSTMPRFYAYYLGVSVLQSAWLERQPAILASLVATWEVKAMGTVGQAHLNDLRSDILGFVDQFINAYYAVNPDHAPIQSPTPEAARVPRKEKRR